MRILVLAWLMFALLGATGPLSIYAEVKRATLDLLEPVSITLTVHNASKRAIDAVFSNADTYDIRITSPTGTDLWEWAKAHTAAPVERHILFPPGNTVLVTHVWDTLLGDRRALAPGLYTLHATLADENYRVTTSVALPFSRPEPISLAITRPVNSTVIVGGTLQPVGTTVEVVDSSGTFLLDRRIGADGPTGRFVVRGYVTKANGQLLLTVDRWARAFDNLPPSPTPAPVRVFKPLPTPTPTPTKHP